MITRTFEAGWSDPSLNVGALVYGDTDFGKIYVTGEVVGDQDYPFAELIVNRIPADMQSFKVKIMATIRNGSSYGGYGYLELYDSNGVLVDSASIFVPSDGTKTGWFELEVPSEGTYYLVFNADFSYPDLISIDGLGFAGIVDYGRRDYVNYVFRVLPEYYDDTNSTTDYEHDVTFWYMGIPARAELVTVQHTTELTEYETDVIEDILFPEIDEAGNNFHSDIDLTGVMILNSNGFYQQTQYYNKAIAELIIGGEVKATIDLIANDVGYTTPEFSILAGTYNDAKVRFTINPKQPDQYIRHIAQVSFNFKFTSDYESPTA